MPLDERDPRSISTYLLARTGNAIAEGDFETFATCFEIPSRVETFEGQNEITSVEDLKLTFLRVRAAYGAEDSGEFVRHCVEAQFRDADTVEATHETRHIKGEVLEHRPFPVFSVLARTNGTWRVRFSQYAIVDYPELALALRPS